MAIWLLVWCPPSLSYFSNSQKCNWLLLPSYLLNIEAQRTISFQDASHHKNKNTYCLRRLAWHLFPTCLKPLGTLLLPWNRDDGRNRVFLCTCHGSCQNNVHGNFCWVMSGLCLTSVEIWHDARQGIGRQDPYGWTMPELLPHALTVGETVLQENKGVDTLS